MYSILKFGTLFIGLLFTLSSSHPGIHASRVFERVPCAFGLQEYKDVECGRLTVSENRTVKNSRKLALSFAIVKSHHTEPALDPVVFIPGGPGIAASNTINQWLKSDLRKTRDIILLDLRGTGNSEPALCPGLSVANIRAILESPTEQQEIEERIKLAEACLGNIQQSNLDLQAYSSSTMAEDLEDLRKALGVAKWNLYGISYGCRVAQRSLELNPTSIRSLILESGIPMEALFYNENTENFQRSVKLLSSYCQGDPKCNKQYRGLESNLYELLKKCQAQPILIRQSNGRVYTLNGQRIMLIIQQLLYDKNLIGLVPLLIDKLKNNDLTLIQSILNGLMRQAETINYGLYYAVQSNEVLPLNTLEKFKSNAAEFPSLLGGLCYYKTDLMIFDTWEKSKKIGTKEASFAENRVPAMIYTGDMDPISPPSYGKLMQSRLPGSQYFEFKGWGHGVSASNPCANNLIIDFLNNPQKKLNGACAQQAGKIDFLFE